MTPTNRRFAACSSRTYVIRCATACLPRIRAYYVTRPRSQLSRLLLPLVASLAVADRRKVTPILFVRKLVRSLTNFPLLQTLAAYQRQPAGVAILCASAQQVPRPLPGSSSALRTPALADQEDSVRTTQRDSQPPTSLSPSAVQPTTALHSSFASQQPPLSSSAATSRVPAHGALRSDCSQADRQGTLSARRKEARPSARRRQLSGGCYARSTSAQYLDAAAHHTVRRRLARGQRGAHKQRSTLPALPYAIATLLCAAHAGRRLLLVTISTVKSTERKSSWDLKYKSYCNSKRLLVF